MTKHDEARRAFLLGAAVGAGAVAGATLVPDAQCTIQVFFKPVIPGPRIGNLDIMGSDPASPHFIALNGIGI